MSSMSRYKSAVSVGLICMLFCNAKLVLALRESKSCGVDCEVLSFAEHFLHLKEVAFIPVYKLENRLEEIAVHFRW